MKRLLLIGMTASFLTLLTACGSSEAEAHPTTTVASTTTIAPTTTTTKVPTPTTTEAALFHSVPDNSVVVTGTTECDFSDGGTDPEDESSGLLAVCELDTSDPRVSGTERDDRFRVLVSNDIGDVWVAEEAIITTEAGTWRGFMQAVDDAWPCGEAHFKGEDAYEGLEFHYYYCDVDGDALLKGWISGSG